MGSTNDGPDPAPPPPDSAEILHLTMPAVPGAVALARRQLTRFLLRLQLVERVVDDLGVAVGEALSNSVKHGRGRSGGKVELRARLVRGGIEIRIVDDGPGFIPGPRPVEPPGAGALRGFGMYLMYSLMDEVEYDEDGTSVRLFKALRRN